MGQFAPNFAQTLIRPRNTIRKSVVVIVIYLVVLYFGPLLVYQNSFDNVLSGGSTDASRRVWCKSLKLPRWSLKEYIFHLSRFCEWKVSAKVRMAYTKQFSCMQGTQSDEVQ